MRLPLFAACLLLSACGGAPEPEAEAVAPSTATAESAATAETAAAPAAAAPAAVAVVVAEPADAAASRALLEAYLLAWNQHDADKAASYLADDVVMFDALLGKFSNGRGEARDKVIGMYLRAVPDGQLSFRNEPVVSASGVSYEWTLTGTNLGDWATYLRGKGQKIDFKGISIVRIKDGKIVYQANYFDTNALGQQAGW